MSDIPHNGTKNGAFRHASARGPKINLRFRTKRELEDVRRAARLQGMSINSYVLSEVLAQARNYLSYRG